MIAAMTGRYTIEEYIKLEQATDERLEYFNGEVRAVACSYLNHARISGNTQVALQESFPHSRGEVFNSQMPVKTAVLPPYRYPDGSLVCGKAIFDEIDGQVMLVNPTLIVEVLASVTSIYDLTDKFTAYKSIDSFAEYLLIRQEKPHVIHYLRQPNGKWLRTDIEGLDADLTLESINVVVPLREIYEDVDFDFRLQGDK